MNFEDEKIDCCEDEKINLSEEVEETPVSKTNHIIASAKPEPDYELIIGIIAFALVGIIIFVPFLL